MSEPLAQRHNTPARRETLTACQIDGEAVLYDPAHHSVHYLNATASAIWDCCDGANTIEHITDEVATTFELPSTRNDARLQLREDVRATLETMADDGLIDYREVSEA